MQKNDTDVLIVGAGPTGLLLACQLAWRGVAFRLIEKNREPSLISKALVIQARTLEIFDQMGIVAPFLAQGQPGIGVQVYVAGKARARVHFGNLGEGLSRYPYMLMLEQNKTEQILLDRLHSLGGDVEWQSELLSMQDEGASVSAEIKVGTGAVERVSARYLVGADGAHSVVRKALNLPFRGSTNEESFVLADAAVTGEVAHDYVNVAMTPSGLAAFFPLPGQQRFRVMAAVPNDLVRADGVDQRQFEASYNDYLRHVVGLAAHIHDTNWFTNFRVHHRVVDRFQVGRIFLAGDAAHIHSPAGGQGMNTGLQDAANLAWKLALVVQEQASPALLDSYNLERLPFAQQLVRTVDDIFTVMSSSAAWASFVRLRLVPLLLPRLTALRFVRHFLFRTVSQIQVNYRKSPLARQEGKFGHSRVQAGDRLPYLFVNHPSSGERLCLHDLLRDRRFQLFVFDRTGNPPPLPALSTTEQEQIAIQAIPYTADGAATFAALGIQTSALFLVRPDGYIAYRNQPANWAQIKDALVAMGLKVGLAYTPRSTAIL